MLQRRRVGVAFAPMIRSKFKSVLDQMTLRRDLRSAMAISGALAALLPTVVLAHGFSRPARLPSGQGPWLFAVNDRGQALAATSDLVYPIERSGRLGPPWQLAVPGGFSDGVTSLVLDDRGRVAAGLAYGDGSFVPEDSAHNVGCCAHVAVGSWQLGTTPPIAQVLAPPTDHRRYSNVGAPQLVIGPTAVTAIWSAGGGVDPLGAPLESHLDEAFGGFGQPLQAAELLSVPKGIQSVHLSLASNGDPVAAWRENTDELGTLVGLRTGGLPSSARLQHVPGYDDASEGEEFSSDLQGDTVFTYLSGSFSSASRVMAMTSTAGSPFGRPRVIASIGAEAAEPTVVAGGHRSLLAFWTCIALTPTCSKTWGRLMSIPGPRGAPFEVGAKPQGFIDSHGRTVILYEGNWAIEAITSQPGRPFGRPRRISPSHRECQPGTGGNDEPPVATSRNGAAIFYFTCDGHAHQYLVRYAP
jgi:hypothetical protein